MTTNPLADALAELRSVTAGPAMGQPWETADFVSDTTGEAFASVVATILNAVLSGQLITLETCNARVAAELAALQDPLVVHLNMVAGKIAKPLPSQLVHIYGEDTIRAALDRVKREARAVKPLVFSEFREGGCVGRPHSIQYFITQDHQGQFWCHHDDSKHDSLHAAQAHAQTHYQTAALADGEPT